MIASASDKKPIIAFLGAGNMGSSLIGGLIADQYDPKFVWATNSSEEKLSELKQVFNVNTSSDNKEAAAYADVIVFSVKPLHLKEVVQEVAAHIIKRRPLLISVAAGVRIKTILNWLGKDDIAVVRCMPNTPSLVGSGATALFSNSFVSDEQKTIAESIMGSVGLAIWLENENDLDTVTALSGSGPAYFFLIMQALQDSAIKLGIKPQVAKLLTIQTALGAAKMALETNKDLLTLKQQVTSPGGTTERALSILEKAGIADLFYEALTAAKKRSEEMANLII